METTGFRLKNATNCVFLEFRDVVEKYFAFSTLDGGDVPLVEITDDLMRVTARCKTSVKSTSRNKDS